jgi:hypothetical protein
LIALARFLALPDPLAARVGLAFQQEMAAAERR